MKQLEDKYPSLFWNVLRMILNGDSGVERLTLPLHMVLTESLGMQISELAFVNVFYSFAVALPSQNFRVYSTSPKLKDHMQYCVDHPEEMDKMAKVKAQVSEVKGIMMENIEKVSSKLPLFKHLSLYI